MSTEISDKSRKYLQNLGALTNMVKRIALEAGELTLEYYEDAGFVGADEKHDGSPVTIADQQAEVLIEARLKEILPDVPMIGEELASRGDADNLEIGEYFWLVDPLDGTKDFIAGGQDYTVNIALIRNQQPVLGVVYAPVRGSLYAAHEGGRAVRWSEDTDKEKEIFVRPEPRGGLTVMASKMHGHPARMNDFLEGFKVSKILRHGSSLKMCMIAAGKGDIYPRFGLTCLWDTAAAHAVLNAAGGCLLDLQGKPLIYNHKAPDFLNPEFVAAGFNWFAEE